MITRQKGTHFRFSIVAVFEVLKLKVFRIKKSYITAIHLRQIYSFIRNETCFFFTLNNHQNYYLILLPPKT